MLQHNGKSLEKNVMLKHSLPALGFLSVLMLLSAILSAADKQKPTAKEDESAMPTFGGKQFWADEQFFHQWRIQRNVVTGHYRLLDEKDRRHAWGTLDDCRQQLNEIKRKQRLPPMKGRAVLVLHGLGRSRTAMDGLAKYLKDGGFVVFNVTYPSTQQEIGEHARSLAHIVENLDGIEEVNFVGHSLGNIVIRHYLADRAAAEAKKEKPAQPCGPPVKRVVMLAPPNHGSAEALLLAENPMFKTVAGETGQQLGRDWDKLEAKLATPGDFGILAGGKGDKRGFNPILAGDNDGTISVATTRLAGASDFLVLPVLHTFIINDPKAREYTLRFLKEGNFVSPAKRKAIPKENAAAPPRGGA
jgi:pimeloyl-ACP methyl ester carboxylesterase